MEASQLDQPISGLTYRQLRELIAAEVRLQMSEAVEPQPQGYLQEPEAAEAVRWLFDHQWTPPAGSPLIVEMLREDRDP